MDLDALLHHYFGTDTPAEASPRTQALGLEQLALDFGVETQPGRKFALWVLLETLGHGPDPEGFLPDYPDLAAAAENWRRMA